jgi:hypothetical protein
MIDVVWIFCLAVAFIVYFKQLGLPRASAGTYHYLSRSSTLPRFGSSIPVSGAFVINVSEFLRYLEHSLVIIQTQIGL